MARTIQRAFRSLPIKLLSFSLGVGVPIVNVNSQKRMKNFSSRLLLLFASIFVVLFVSGLAVAQIPPAPRPSPTPPPQPVDGTIRNPNDPPLTEIDEELRAKRAIKAAEKDHLENIKRAREIAEIGKNLKESLKDKSVLDRDSLKKVERLEKLTKKIRSEAGGQEEEVEIPKKPSDLPSTVTQIADASEKLSKNVEDTPRQVVSASVIGDANVLLELLKMVRAYARQL